MVKEKNETFTNKYGAEMERKTVIEVGDNGNEKIIGVLEYGKPVEPVEPEPTQLDRIESLVSKSQEQIAQEARDEYTLELIENGVI